MTGPDYSADLMAALASALRAGWMEGWRAAEQQQAQDGPQGLWPYTPDQIEEAYRDWLAYGTGSLMPGAPPRPLRILGACTNPSPELRQTYVPPPMPDPVELKATPRTTQAEFDARTAEQRADPEYRRVYDQLKAEHYDAYGPTEQL